MTSLAAAPDPPSSRARPALAEFPHAMGEFRERLAALAGELQSSGHGRTYDEVDDVLGGDVGGPDQQAELRRRQRDPELSFG
jgi:hypothetical protein